MTPAARIAAAIDILDQSLAGAPTERVLTTWARANRFAGSKDRAAIRDLVYDAVRCRRSYAALGGAMTGRGLMIGRLRDAGEEPAVVFTGEGYAPPPLTEAERTPPADLSTMPDAVRLDLPDWIFEDLGRALGAALPPVAERLRTRAPVFLRVNLLKADRQEAVAALAGEGILAKPHPLSDTALEVIEGARKLRNSTAYLGGLVELQDVASQAVVDRLDLRPGMRVLDFCAGGGGKALGVAARLCGPVWVHDADPGRMSDVPARAARAGADLRPFDPADIASDGPFDLVLADVPCSGSGAWRRQPDAKWALNPGRLADLLKTQAHILDEVAGMVAPGGILAYATCALLRSENEDQVSAFLERSDGWRVRDTRRFSPLDGGDGLFVAQLTRE